ncbi:hypothetical protein [Herbaspirillum seropedicae]|uniref:hypothetical protein n=1 Tax=Herbaspirillum seropedicae TaxID=964 RepID=UPI0028673724|nr:hypothetical protein [Herbaspirillum seropedicae]MDR6395254.1 hypothetical protein [Herbaspirillum seropedicae]
MLALSHISSRFAFSSITSQLDHVVGAHQLEQAYPESANRRCHASLVALAEGDRQGEHQSLR